jgi:hypothetical protein
MPVLTKVAGVLKLRSDRSTSILKATSNIMKGFPKAASCYMNGFPKATVNSFLKTFENSPHQELSNTFMEQLAAS